MEKSSKSLKLIILHRQWQNVLTSRAKLEKPADVYNPLTPPAWPYAISTSGFTQH